MLPHYSLPGSPRNTPPTSRLNLVILAAPLRPRFVLRHCQGATIDGERLGDAGCTGRPVDEQLRCRGMKETHFRLLLWLPVDGDDHEAVVEMLHRNHPSASTTAHAHAH